MAAYNSIIKDASSRFKINELMGALSGINKVHGCVVQVFNPECVIDKMHLEGAYANAIAAFKSNTNISKSVAIEMLLYSAMTRQIGEAIKKMGAKSGRRFILFANNGKAYEKAKGFLSSSKDYKTTTKHASEVAKRFGINVNRDLDLFVLQKMALSKLD